MKTLILFCTLSLLATLLFAQQIVTFHIRRLPSAKTPVTLFLAGDFNNWNPGDSAWRFEQSAGSLYLAKNIAKGIIHFKITRGSWKTVECSLDGTPIADRNLMIQNDTTVNLKVEQWQDNFAEPEKRHTASKQVHIISEKFDMPQLGRQRRVWIYLPKGYNDVNRYPVIYMQDGQNLFDGYTASYGEWGVDEIMDKITDASQSIIVGIDHGGDNRIPEYDPYDSKFGKGRGDDYTDFLINTLKPYIDKHYKTKADALHTSIAGSSMGGLISMYAALKYPYVFGNAGIFSPAFWIAPDIYTFASKQSLPAGSRFYFVCGDAESESMVADVQKMVSIIKGKVENKVVIIKGAGHNEKQWHGDFPAFYEWLLKK